MSHALALRVSPVNLSPTAEPLTLLAERKPSLIETYVFLRVSSDLSVLLN